MPLAFHYDLTEKFRQQYVNAEKYLTPFIESVVPLDGKQILEIGCGEGGTLKSFLNKGCRCFGIDLSATKILYANEAMKHEVAEGLAAFMAADIYDPFISERYLNRFDLVILKDTIEHLVDRQKLLGMIKRWLAEGGVVFVAFPPWLMPYGGHQQMADTPLGKLPYCHLLPRPIYRRLLKLFGEDQVRIQGLMEVVDTRLTIHGFEQLLKKCGYRPIKKRLYLINPIYESKFGCKPIKQFSFIRALPWVRDVVTTTCYYLVKPLAGSRE